MTREKFPEKIPFRLTRYNRNNLNIKLFFKKFMSVFSFNAMYNIFETDIHWFRTDSQPY